VSDLPVRDIKRIHGKALAEPGKVYRDENGVSYTGLADGRLEKGVSLQGEIGGNSANTEITKIGDFERGEIIDKLLSIVGFLKIEDFDKFKEEDFDKLKNDFDIHEISFQDFVTIINNILLTLSPIEGFEYNPTTDEWEASPPEEVKKYTSIPLILKAHFVSTQNPNFSDASINTSIESAATYFSGYSTIKGVLNIISITKGNIDGEVKLFNITDNQDVSGSLMTISDKRLSEKKSSELTIIGDKEYVLKFRLISPPSNEKIYIYSAQLDLTFEQ